MIRKRTGEEKILGYSQVEKIWCYGTWYWARTAAEEQSERREWENRYRVSTAEADW